MKRKSVFGGFWINASTSFKDYFRHHKVLIFSLAILLLVAILTGVFTAIKNVDNYSAVWFDNYNIMQFYKSKMGTWDLFFSRLGSYLICLVVMLVCSLNVFLSPLSIAVLLIRGYLVGLNACFMFLLFGFNGIITTIIVIIPCQLASLVLLMTFLSLMLIRAKNKRKYGISCMGGEKGRLSLFGIYLVLFIAINIVETLLLYLFSSKLILVV